ncbi:retrovirus-related pol polyprotein from transposon TNT 1-94 [Tanacetum coccineum]
MIDQEKEAIKQSNAIRQEFEAQCNRQNLLGKATKASNTNSFNTVSTPVNVATAPRTSNVAGPSSVSLGISFPLNVNDLPNDPLMPDLERADSVQDPRFGLFELPYGRRLKFGTKSVYRNKKDERGLMQSEEVYVSQPLGFVDPKFLEKVYKVEKALYGLHQAPKAWYETLSTYLLDNGFYKGQIDKTLFIKRVKGDILLDKYVGEILKKFGFSIVRTASTPMETNKVLTKDEDGEDVDVHLYTIGSLMYLTSSRPNIIHKKTQNRRRTKKHTKLPQTSVPQDLEADKVVHTEGGDSVERAITTVASLDAAQDRWNINLIDGYVPSLLYDSPSPSRLHMEVKRVNFYEDYLLEEKKVPTDKIIREMMTLAVRSEEERNIMDGVDIDNLTIEQYLRLTQESAESDCDPEDMEEEVEYITGDKVVMSEQGESNHGYTWNIQHLKEKDDVDKWLNAKITKHMSMQRVENMKDALISIIKSIRHEIKDDIMKRQFEASTASVSDEVSSIASNKVDKADDNTSNTAPCRLPRELSPRSFLLLFTINNHNFYATTTLDAKDNVMLQIVYEYLGLDKLGGIDIFSYEYPACLQFEQRTRSYGTPKPQDEIAGPNSLSPGKRGLVKRWHVCKPIHVTYDDGSGEDCGMWPTCYHDSKFCFGYNEVFGVNEQGTLRQCICFRDHERRDVKGSYIGFADFLQIRYGQQKIDDTIRERRTFEVKKYSFKGGRSFICITDREDEALPLERVNGARFKAMIRKELEGNKIQKLGGNY